MVPSGYSCRRREGRGGQKIGQGQETSKGTGHMEQEDGAEDGSGDGEGHGTVGSDHGTENYSGKTGQGDGSDKKT